MKATTQSRIDRIIKRAELYMTPGQVVALREIVEYELREQDKQTRHACAEAAGQAFDDMYGHGDISIPNGSVILFDKINQAILNAQSV